MGQVQRRRRRGGSITTMDGFVAHGMALSVAPTTDSGHVAYGTLGREFLPVGGEAASALQVGVPANGSPAGITMGCLWSPHYAVNDGVNHYLLQAGTTGPRFKKQTTNTLGGLLSSTVKIATGALSFSADTAHYVIGRWDDTHIDLNFDGVSRPQQACTALPAASTLWIGGFAGDGDGNGYFGMVFYMPVRKSDAWLAALNADTSVWSDPVRFFNQYMDIGDQLTPLNGTSTTYRKTAGSGLPFDDPAALYSVYTTGEFRDMAHVGSTYYCYDEYINASPDMWSIRTRTGSLPSTLGSQSGAVMAGGGSGKFDEKGQADPTVVYDGVGDWKMWFDARNASDQWLGLGYATSTDGLSWTKYGTDPVIAVGGAGTWDSAFIHHPCVHKVGSTYHMFYAGSDVDGCRSIGHATATDGIAWMKDAANPVLARGGAGAFDAGYLRPSSPVLVDGTWWMFYWAIDGAQKQDRIGIASSTDLSTWTKRGILWEPAAPFATDGTNIYGDRASAAIYEDSIVRIWLLRTGSSLSGLYLATVYPSWLARKLS